MFPGNIINVPEDISESEIYALMTAFGFPLRKWDEQRDPWFGDRTGWHVVDLGYRPDGNKDEYHIDDLCEWWRQWIGGAYFVLCRHTRLKLLRDTWSSDGPERAAIDAWIHGRESQPFALFSLRRPWLSLGATMESDAAETWVATLTSLRPHSLCSLSMDEEEADLCQQMQVYVAEHERDALSRTITRPHTVSLLHPARI